MKNVHTSPRVTGNKTVTQPKTASINKGGSGHTSLPASALSKGHHKLGTIPVYTPPTTEPNNKP